MRHLSRSGVALLAVASGVLVGCDPPAPVTLTVNSGGSQVVDSNPGDGICEIAPGTGTCTIGAAVHEGVQHARAEVVLSAERYTTEWVHVTVSNDLVIRSGSAAGTSRVPRFGVTVAQGGNVRLQGITFEEGGYLDVSGRAAASRIRFTSSARGPGVRVLAGGFGEFRTSRFESATASNVFQNEGTAIIQYSTLVTENIGLHTVPGASSMLRATAIVNSGILGTGCNLVHPQSLGYNDAEDLTCGFTAVGDSQGTDNPTNNPARFVDRIPVGTAGCGSDLVATPIDGNGDGIAACDVGDREHPAPA